MYPDIVPNEGNIQLVQNSGIQFVDYDVMVDWKSKDNLSVIRAIEEGYFKKFPGSKDEPLVRLVPKFSTEVSYWDPLSDRVVDPSTANYTVRLRDSLKLYNGVWFPVPYIPEHIDESHYGPINWVRARIVKVTDQAAIDQYLIAHGEKPVLSPNAVQYDEALAPSQTSSLNASISSTSAEAQLPRSAFARVAGAFNNVIGGGNGKEPREYYRVVLAFDTNTQEYDDFSGYFAPTERDVESGINFKLGYTADKCQPFLKSVNDGLPWVNEWIQSVFRDLYRERVEPKISREELDGLMEQEHAHESHYLNVLAFLGFMINPAPVRFIANHTRNVSVGSSKVVDVSLILDIGNARSCGIMVENHPNVTRGDDDFSDTYVLTLRDLNAPEQVYNEPFVSRIEFSKPDFDYDNRSARSGRPDAFNWPSMVRVGPEAEKLSAHREGNEGSTGLTSPKRYLWNTDPLTNDHWVFNNYSYLIDSNQLRTQRKTQTQRAYLNTIGTYFNTEGKAYFALDKDDNCFDNLESRYSNHSTMTFMLIEIILQAMVQMNSVAQRRQCNSSDAPRRLKAIILTTPPSMPAEERELYRACVYEAIGILWKSLGFDQSSPQKFYFGKNRDANDDSVPEINPPVPEIYMDWNEAEAGQVVYIYNESQKVFRGHCKDFIRYLRRPTISTRIAERLVDDEGNPLLSTRIASLDIGGGTTDLVIKDYTFKANEADNAADIIPKDVYNDGFKIAGDDILHDLIKECIMPRLAYTLVRHGIKYRPVLQQLVGENNTGNVRNEMLRAQLTQQIFVKIAYKILFHLEHLDPLAVSCKVVGTVQDFINDTESNPSLPVTMKRPGPYEQPNPEVVAFVDGIMGRYLNGFKIMDFKLSFDIAQINRALVAGSKFNIVRVLSKLAEVLASYDCDLLLLTGRSSKLPAIRSFFMQRLSLPSSRILPMHTYRCDTWYPFKRDGEYIGDPKTTASVGALLCYLRLSHDKFPNFRFYSYPEDVTNNAHYVGILDNSNMISDSSVLYKYESSNLVARKNMTNEEDEESNFIPYKRDDDAFKTQLSVELGYRLLDDPEVEATPLYKIEAFNDVEEIQKLKQARVLSYNDLTREEITALFDQIEDPEVYNKYHSQVMPLLERYEQLKQEAQASGLADTTTNSGDLAQQFPVLDVHRIAAQDPVVMDLKVRLESELQAAAQAEAEAQVEKPSGLKSLFGGKDKYEQDMQAVQSAIFQERYETEVTQKLLDFVVQQQQQDQSELQALENQLHSLLNEAIDANIEQLRLSCEQGFEQLRRKLDIERVQFKVTLKTVNKHSPYPVAFIKASLPHLRQVETFQLERVEIENSSGNFTRYFRMYLKTISGAKVKYFMDSGAIDLNGVNPRFIL